MGGVATLLRGRRVDHHAPHGIPGLFRDQRRRTPDAVACSDPERSLSYTELDLLSDEMAAAILHSTGGRRGAVMLRMPRRVDLLVALLGVLKAGCHYVPIAADEPGSRVEVMVDVVQPLCSVVIAGQEALAVPGIPALAVPRAAAGPPAPLRPVDPDDPVYALFTSGSTGVPKAVLLGSAALSNRILWMARQFALTDQDRVLQKTPYTFDVAGWEFFLPVVTGARCVFAAVDAHYDAREIGRAITKEGITVCHFVPTMLEAYLRLAQVEENISLRLVFCSGEALPPGLASRFIRCLGAQLHNLYGPTEAGIDVTHWPVPRDLGPQDEVFIGAPIDNVDLRVLDPDGAPVEPGAVGELWIGGVQVALGYVGRPDLTEAAFAVDDDGRRWYRTGDLVAAEGGQLRYLGRTDAQVKIRGVRVEPGEVETVLTGHPAVGQAAVVPVESPDGDGLELIAVAVRAKPVRAASANSSTAAPSTAAPSPAAPDHEILAFVGERLPRAFVPHLLIWVDQLPLTSSGKADRRRIGHDAAHWWASAAAAAAEQPDPAGQDEVAHEWWRVLGTPADQQREEVGFLNLGGHSLTAARLVARISALRRVDVPLSALLRDNLSLARFRALVAEAAPSAERPSAPTPRDRSPLTPAQEPLWLLNRVLADDSGNNVVGSLLIPAAVDEQILRTAVGDVIARHDALRAAVRVAGGVPEWSYADNADVRMHSSSEPGPLDDSAIGRFVGEVATKAIALDQPPLMNVGLLRSTAVDVAAADASRQSLLTVSLHHIVADQRALELVLEDIAVAYAARSGAAAPAWPAAAPSFADFAHERATTVDSPAWHDDMAHWEQLLRDAPARTPLPFRLNGPGRPTLAGHRIAVELGAEVSDQIDAFLTGHGHTRATYFVSCVAAVLAAWAGQPSVTVGMPVSQRWRPTEVDLVGLVLGTAPLWLTVGDRLDRDALLAHVRDRYIEALDHAAPTFQAIAHRLGLPPSPQDNPLFQVWVNDLSRTGTAPEFAGVPVRWVDTAPPEALFDLNFYLRRGDGYRLELVCGLALYDDIVVEHLLRQVVEVATAFAGGQVPFGEERPLETDAPETVPTAAPDPLSAIRAVAVDRPNAVAVLADSRSWTYAELIEQAEQLAAAVTGLGVGPGDVLELRAARTPDLPAALLGAWMAGAAAAITDASLPVPVLAEQQVLLRPRAVLTPGRPDPLTASGETDPRRLDGISHILFTSGTSGRPAAVAVPPAALAGTLHWYVETYGLGPADRVAMLGGLGHDPLLRDILAPLLAGGTVVVPPEDIFTAPDRLFALLRDEQISVLHATPALLEMILSGRPSQETGSARLDRLRLVVSGGAPLTAGLVRALRTITSAPVVNAYGTTESPQIASGMQVAGPGESLPETVPDEAVLPVGSGVGRTELSVIRPDGSAAPVGHSGEIVIRSSYLAAGYLDGSGRNGTLEPAQENSPWGTYRTGDRGRRDPAGAIVPDGRLDRQISVDGHRLDPEQIERAALSHPGVHRALARLVQTAAGPMLSLSVIAPASANPAPSIAELRSHLRRHLPRYAVPAEVSVVAEFVLDHHHKVVGARGVLPDAGAPRTGSGAAVLLDEIARLVRDIVGADLSRTENFFDAGLNSMAVVRLHALLRERLAVDLPVTAMFEHPNLTALARFISGGPPPATAPEPRNPRAPRDRAPDDGQARRRRQLRQGIRRDFEGQE
jgi:amino acid adenylation domain-containing protein